MESTMRQYINLIETYSSPNEEHNKILNENYINKNTDVLHPARLQVLAGVIEREAEYYKNLYESADKQFEELSDSDREFLYESVETIITDIIKQEALEEKLALKENQNLNEVEVKEMMLKYAKRAKAAVSMFMTKAVRKALGLMTLFTLDGSIDAVKKLLALRVPASLWFYNMVCNYILAPIKNVAGKLLLIVPLAAVGLPVAYFAGKDALTTTGVEPIDNVVKPTLDAAEDIVRKGTDGMEFGVGPGNAIDNIGQGAENIINMVGDMFGIEKKADFADKIDTATDQAGQKIGDLLTGTGGDVDVPLDTLDQNIVQPITEYVQQTPYEQMVQMYDDMGWNMFADILDVAGNITADMIIPAGNAIWDFLNLLGVQATGAVLLIMFVYGAVNTAKMGGFWALFNRQRGLMIAQKSAEKDSKEMSEDIKAQMQELSDRLSKVEKEKDSVPGDQAPPGAEQPTNIRPQVS